MWFEMVGAVRDRACLREQDESLYQGSSLVYTDAISAAVLVSCTGRYRSRVRPFGHATTN